MSRQLDRLIKKYNQSKMQVVKSVPRRKAYSEEVVDEKEVEELIEAIAENSKELEEAENILNKTKNKLKESVDKITETAEEVAKAYRLALMRQNMKYNKIISPRMYRRILSYYIKHRGRKYYSRYKIDNDLHNFFMRLGQYLESLETGVRGGGGRGFSSQYHYYALPSLAILLGSWKEALGYLSAALIEFYHFIHHPLHILMELSPKILHSIPLLPGILPHFLVGVLVVFLAGGLFTIISYSLHPDRKAKFKKLGDKIKITLGLHKDRRYAIYLTFIYKLYDILSTVMSSIILIRKNIKSNKQVDTNKSAKKLEKSARKSIGTHGGLLDKVISIFNKKNDKMNILGDVISVDFEHYDKLVESIKEGNKDLSVCRYKLSLTSEAMSKLAEYYGDKFRSGGEWIEFTVEYQGGAYHKSAKPLEKLEVSGFEGGIKEASKFIAGALALADKIIIDKIGDQEFKNGILTINLETLKWLAYRGQPIVAKFIGIIRDLIETEDKITKENIGYEMFDSYVSVMKLKALAESEEALQDKEENKT
jgi:hypothetical protein